jgi:hypothetical protein
VDRPLPKEKKHEVKVEHHRCVLHGF